MKRVWSVCQGATAAGFNIFYRLFKSLILRDAAKLPQPSPGVLFIFFLS